jgi:hypothetical protein
MRRILCIALCCLAGCGQKHPTEEEQLEKSIKDAIPIIKATQEQAVEAQQQAQQQNQPIEPSR